MTIYTYEMSPNGTAIASTVVVIQAFNRLHTYIRVFRNSYGRMWARIESRIEEEY